MAALPPGTNVLLQAASQRIHRSGEGIAHTTIAGVVGELGPLDSVSLVVIDYCLMWYDLMVYNVFLFGYDAIMMRFDVI